MHLRQVSGFLVVSKLRRIHVGYIVMQMRKTKREKGFWKPLHIDYSLRGPKKLRHRAILSNHLNWFVVGVFVLFCFLEQIRREKPSAGHAYVTILCRLSKLCGGWRTGFLSAVNSFYGTVMSKWWACCVAKFRRNFEGYRGRPEGVTAVVRVT